MTAEEALRKRAELAAEKMNDVNGFQDVIADAMRPAVGLFEALESIENWPHDEVSKCIDVDPAGNTYEVSCSPRCRVCLAKSAMAAWLDVEGSGQ